MVDFLMISKTRNKRGEIEIKPKFIIRKSSDLMIRGKDFYAIWLEDQNRWSTNEQDAIDLIDRELDKYAKEHTAPDEIVHIFHLWDAENGMIDRWLRYCQKQKRDSYHMLDEKIIFSNMEACKEDYSSKSLLYPLEDGDISAYDEIMSTLYSEKERHKIEWAIGSIVTGDSKFIEKFLVLYGEGGTGKSTILKLIEKLFEGYVESFEGKSLASANNQFAMEAFRSNPLVAVDHEGDLSHIEDNTRINALVAHNVMRVNEKFKATYSAQFKCFLFMATNKAVKITDAKSGIIRRLIDVAPTGERIKPKRFKMLEKQMYFELGAIASHCRDVYLSNPGIYDDYIPVRMIGETNHFYNFIMEQKYLAFVTDDFTTLGTTYEEYKVWCEKGNIKPENVTKIKAELKNYFHEYKDRYAPAGKPRMRSCYFGFRSDRFEMDDIPEKPVEEQEEQSPYPEWLQLTEHTSSNLDILLSDDPAQYANKEGHPRKPWAEVKTKLKDLDNHKQHFVNIQDEHHIVIDLDICDENGNKSKDLNLKRASIFPPTYAELSRGGEGLHLHYIYSGDVKELNDVFDTKIEIKNFLGGSSLRRKLSSCNDLQITTISSGLPKKKGKKNVIDKQQIQNEEHLVRMIKKNLNKEIHPNTKPSMDYIYALVEEAYNSGVSYNIKSMSPAIFAFAASSTNQSKYCVNLLSKMHLASKDQEKPEVNDVSVLMVNPATARDFTINVDSNILFFDCEVYPNLFIVCWKHIGPEKDSPMVTMTNPTAAELESVFLNDNNFPVGFNCLRYDNHIIYARIIGYDLSQLYGLSQDLISNKKGAGFIQSRDISGTDIYDFASKKQSLKKWEIELGETHMEMSIPWDKPVKPELWHTVAEYCKNDVRATEALWNHLLPDFEARKMLASLSGLSLNHTTNQHTTKMVFGNNRNPQKLFKYRNMGDTNQELVDFVISKDLVFSRLGDDFQDGYTKFTTDGKPVFPGYTHILGKSTYRGEDVGQGGYVYAEPGMYGHTVTFDITSMHPHSMIAEELFGPYTSRVEDLVKARVLIKGIGKVYKTMQNSKDEDEKALCQKEIDNKIEQAKTMLNGELVKHLNDLSKMGDLAQALKIAINSIYGLTAASFDNPFRDPRNIDNIVAKRGALFMINLKHLLQDRGVKVIHIKTDSIKVVDPTPEVANLIKFYGEMYGYNFEVESEYEKICLVNDAVYIAKTMDGHWEATGTQFAVPYVYKTLFSHEPITFRDLCETKSVKTALYLDMCEDLPDVSDYEKQLKKAGTAFKKGDMTEAEYKAIEEDLKPLIDTGHHYIFVGRVGQFCPMLPGTHGGILLREQNGKYNSVTGTKGYFWMESEMVKETHKEKDIDMSYYMTLVNDARDAIAKYGDLEWFLS